MRQYLSACGGAAKLRQKYLFGFILGLLLASSGPAAAGGRFYFTTILTNRTYASGQDSGPMMISDTGYICGYVPYTNNLAAAQAAQAARWNPDGTLVELGVYDTNVDVVAIGYGVNNAGQVVGYSASTPGDVDHAVLFSVDQNIEIPTANGGMAKAINDGGVIVGFTLDAMGRPLAFRWDGVSTNTQYIGDIPYDDDQYVAAEAPSVNSQTQVVGRASNQDQTIYLPYIWTPAAGLTILPGFANYAKNYPQKVNNNGVMLVLSIDYSEVPDIYWLRNSDGTATVLPAPGALRFSCYDLNDFGVVLGMVEIAKDEFRGCIYDAVRGWRHIEDLIGDDVSRYNIHQVNLMGLNNCGRIVSSIVGNDDHYYGVLFTPVAERRNDFDGDGKSDLALYDPVSGLWFVCLSGSNYALGMLTLGGADLPPIAADFDGDGKADPAVYDELSAVLSVRLSNNGYALASIAGFGGVGFEPVVADFDGDGKADPAVYEGITGTWLYCRSNQSYTPAGVRGFGGLGFTPAPGDYDGDQKTDLAVYHEASGSWFIRPSTNSSGEELYVALGGPGCEVVYGDFDGDALIDPAVYNESTGHWMARMSRSGLTAGIIFGGPGMAALPVDYDGDGLADPAVFHLTDAVWSAAFSGSGYALRTAYFGGAGLGYIPIR